MKKTVLLLIFALTLLSLFGCKENKYPPVKSTSEEAKAVIELKIDNEEYEVKYELYRALFLNNKSSVDGGDSLVWTSADSKRYIDEINAVIIDKATEIYSVIHLSKQIGFDPFSKEVDLKIEEYIVGAVEGDDNQLGHGSYENYLASLKQNNLNYSVATLMLRYAMANEAISEYYLGKTDPILGRQDGKFEYTKDEVKAYYDGNDCVRVLQAYFQTGVKTYAQMKEYKLRLAEFDDEKSLAAYIIGSTAATEPDLIKDGEVSGIVFGKNELNGTEYLPYINEAFSLSDGELSNIITLENTGADGYYLLYRLEKTDAHFEAEYSSIRDSYIENCVGTLLKTAKTNLTEGAEFTSGYEDIDHSSISMD